MSNFEKALKKVLLHEGGYVDDPNDKGGETKYGISKRSYPNIDVENLTLAESMDIYRNDYWLPNKYDKISCDFIASQLFDLCVNIGARNANKIAQNAYNFLCSCADEDLGYLDVDGKIGDKTLDAINSFVFERENALYLTLIERYATDYYVKLNNKNYLSGWLKRLLKNDHLNY